MLLHIQTKRYPLLSELTKPLVTHDKLTAVTGKPALSFSISVHHVKAAVSVGCENRPPMKIKFLTLLIDPLIDPLSCTTTHIVIIKLAVDVVRITVETYCGIVMHQLAGESLTISSSSSFFLTITPVVEYSIVRSRCMKLKSDGDSCGDRCDHTVYVGLLLSKNNNSLK